MTQESNIIVITSCTNRKRKVGAALALESTETVESLCELARKWRQQVEAAPKNELSPAIDLYSGRSITEAKRAAETLATSLYIVSAGHGLISWNTCIPSYNVTVSPIPDNKLHACLTRLRKAPPDWWNALVKEFGQQRSLTALIAESKTSIVLLALPSTYLTLLAGEFATLSEADMKRLRIITSPYGASGLPAQLQSIVMPYDERLEALHGYAGTRSDFPQRALSHFVSVLEGHKLPLDAASEKVRHAMDGLRKPVLPERQRRTDEEITAMLWQNWERFNGSATALLRYLRHEALVACEQSRFRSLRQNILSKLNDEVSARG
jgi:hypothetical protein